MIPPQPAASVILVREQDAGIEVLLQQRSADARFAPSAWVFPGGRLEPGDRPHPDKASEADQDDLAFRRAAIRECFEEAGVLLVRDPPLARLPDWRAELAAGAIDFRALCERESLALSTDMLVFVDCWITPPAKPIRFDTRYFAALSPRDQKADNDYFEMVDTCWVSPLEALRRHERSDWTLKLPTRITLQMIHDARAWPHLLEVLPARRQGVPCAV